MTITEFLEARIAEDEADALPFRNELGETKQWRSDEIGGAVRQIGTPAFGLPDLLAKFETHLESVHVARWDPARVLAECAAKRAVLDLHVNAVEWSQDRDCPDPDGYLGIASGAGDAIRALAAVYEGHPDYQQEWAL